MSIDQVDPGSQLGVGLLISRVVGIAALVVAASAALFVGIGSLGDGDPVVAEAPEEQAAPEPDEDEPQEPDPEPDPAPEEEPEAEADAEQEPESDAEPDTEEPEEAPEEEAPEEEESAPEEEPEPERIDPGSISVQVLDGYQEDGGSAAEAVAAELSDAGYRIVARNPALRYDVTAVLWTAGNEAAGEQIARDIGAAEVREQPGNLSTSVMVHVVVGADRG